jgi:hypothetical protein
MPFKLGNLSGEKIYLGSTEVTNAYLGSNEVYSSGPPSFELGTLSGAGALSGVNYTFQRNGVLFNNDGTKMFTVMYVSSRYRIYEYNLSVPYNITTASYSQNKIIARGTFYHSQFNADGTILFVTDSYNILGYTLTTPFDVSTLSTSFSFNFNTGTRPYVFNFNNDGTRLFLFNGSTIRQYDLSSPYNINTANSSVYTQSVSLTPSHSRSYAMNNDGSKLFVVGRYWNNVNDPIHQFTLTTPFDISNMVYDKAVGYPTAGATATERNISFNADGTMLYARYEASFQRYLRQYTNTF